MEETTSQCYNLPGIGSLVEMQWSFSLMNSVKSAAEVTPETVSLYSPNFSQMIWNTFKLEPLRPQKYATQRNTNWVREQNVTHIHSFTVDEENYFEAVIVPEKRPWGPCSPPHPKIFYKNFIITCSFILFQILQPFSNIKQY